MSNYDENYELLRIMEDDIPAKKRHLEDDDEDEESYDFSNSDIEELNQKTELKIIEQGDLNNNSKNSDESFGSSEDEFEEEDERVIYASHNVINEAVNKTIPIPINGRKDEEGDCYGTPNLVNEDEAIVNFLGDNNDIVRI
jgi:hypothetical protein